MQLLAHSKAGYSTWVYLPALRMLLDAGEGFNDHIGAAMLGVRDVLISHGHTDHYAGLLAIIAGREVEYFARGRRDLPRMRVLYPAGSASLARFFRYARDDTREFDKLVELAPMAPGDARPALLHGDVMITALHQTHGLNEPALAWRLSQRRRHLRADLVGLSSDALREVGEREGREAMHTTVDVPVLGYSGDGQPLRDPSLRGVELLIHEATFLEAEDTALHSSLEQALRTALDLQAAATVLLHFSARHRRAEVEAAVALSGLDVPQLSLVLPDEYSDLEIDVAGL